MKLTWVSASTFLVLEAVPTPRSAPHQGKGVQGECSLRTLACRFSENSCPKLEDPIEKRFQKALLCLLRYKFIVQSLVTATASPLVPREPVTHMFLTGTFVMCQLAPSVSSSKPSEGFCLNYKPTPSPLACKALTLSLSQLDEPHPSAASPLQLHWSPCSVDTCPVHAHGVRRTSRAGLPLSLTLL